MVRLALRIIPCSITALAYTQSMDDHFCLLVSLCSFPPLSLILAFSA